MNGSEILRQIRSFGIVPIIRSNDENKITVAAESLVKAGLGVLELSLSVSNGLRILESLSDRFGGSVFLGAGTVLDVRTARAAVSAGARFIVSPSTDAGVIDACKQRAVACFPGALTPTEIAIAWKCGADAIKVFPVNAVGGPPYIRAILAPFPGMVLFPCGGVSAGNAGEYFGAGAAGLLVGSSLIDMTLPENQLRASIAERAAVLASIAAARTSRP
jgi:2-dehydro-3-deoxyphosphogluconate aldolase/(4S)-4-hydroxy-2-oxoglutarate aldolase